MLRTPSKRQNLKHLCCTTEFYNQHGHVNHNVLLSPSSPKPCDATTHQSPKVNDSTNHWDPATLTTSCLHRALSSLCCPDFVLSLNAGLCDATCSGKVDWISFFLRLVVRLSFPLCFWLGSHPTLCCVLLPGMLVLAKLWWSCTVQKEKPLKENSPDSYTLLWVVRRAAFFPV